MKPISVAGFLLVILGVLALAYQGFTYTHREKVLDVGPIHATKDTQETVPIPPILDSSHQSQAAGSPLLGRSETRPTNRGSTRLNGAA